MAIGKPLCAGFRERREITTSTGGHPGSAERQLGTPSGLSAIGRAVNPRRFRPTPWLRQRHAQTIWRALISRPTPVRTFLELLELPDGDAVELVWGLPLPNDPFAPILVVLHGLEGSIDSRYVRSLVAGGVARGWRTVLLHFRGTAGRVNRKARSYHSGDTADVAFLVAELGRRFPGAPRLAVGISLGGNVLLKWLGETGAANPLSAAAAGCVPCDLAGCAAALSTGFSRVYQRHLVNLLKISVRRKTHLLDVAPEEWARLTDFRTFDARLTAPLNGFASVDDYYARASSRPWLGKITVPTLLVLAEDDPFVPPGTVPESVPSAVTVERHAHGGHVGFLTGWWPRPWLEERLLDWLAESAGVSGQKPTLPRL